jgi:hypothetical protein
MLTLAREELYSMLMKLKNIDIHELQSIDHLWVEMKQLLISGEKRKLLSDLLVGV